MKLPEGSCNIVNIFVAFFCGTGLLSDCSVGYKCPVLTFKKCFSYFTHMELWSLLHLYMADCSFYADTMFLCVILSSQHTEFLEEGYGLLWTWVWFLGGCVETGLPRNSSSFFIWALWHIGYQGLLDISFLRTFSSSRLYQWKGRNIHAFVGFLNLILVHLPLFSTRTLRLRTGEIIVYTLITYFRFSFSGGYLQSKYTISTLILKFMSTPWCNIDSVHLRVLKLLTLSFFSKVLCLKPPLKV